jgi:hypothetical protein
MGLEMADVTNPGPGISLELIALIVLYEQYA